MKKIYKILFIVLFIVICISMIFLREYRLDAIKEGVLSEWEF